MFHPGVLSRNMWCFLPVLHNNSSVLTSRGTTEYQRDPLSLILRKGCVSGQLCVENFFTWWESFCLFLNAFLLFTGKTSSWEKSVKHGGGVKGQSRLYSVCVSFISVMFSPWCCNNICSTARKIHLAKSPSVMLNQTHLKCFYSAKHTHIFHSRAVVGQVGLDSRRGKVNASGSLPTVLCWATSCQAEEEPVLLLPCSTYPTVGVNTVT